MSVSLPDITLQQLLHRVVAFAIVTGVYGFAIAWLARRMGDPGPIYDGRLTPNPVAHLDWFGLVSTLFYRVGWIQAPQIDTSVFRRPLWSIAVLTIGSSGLLLAMAAIALVLRPVVLEYLNGTLALALSGVLLAVSDVAVATAMLNLIPIAPLMGSLWAAAAAPALYRHFERGGVRLVGAVVIVVLLAVGPMAQQIQVIRVQFRGLLGY